MLSEYLEGFVLLFRITTINDIHEINSRIYCTIWDHIQSDDLKELIVEYMLQYIKHFEGFVLLLRITINDIHAISSCIYCTIWDLKHNAVS